MPAAGRYRAIFGTPHVAPLLAASMLARLPIAMFGLALVLYLAAARDSFALAGLVNGAFGIGSAIGTPVQSRLIDRLGQRRVLLPLACLELTAISVLIALTEAGAPTGALTAAGVVGGFALPAVGSAMRTLWKGLLGAREDLLPTAFALDAVCLEVLFTVGPVATAAIIALVSPIAALLLCGVSSLLGTAAFVAQSPSRRWAPDAAAGSHGLLGALRSRGVRTLALAMLPIGFCFGTVEISMPAFAGEFGAPAWAGVLLSVWAVASAAGGLAYGARSWSGPLRVTYLRLAALFPFGFLPALLAPSVPAMALLILPAGLLIAPLAAAVNQLVGEVAPRGAATEAFTWPTTAIIAGFAIGTAAGGALVEAADWRAGFVAATLAAALGALVAFARRASLMPGLQPA